MATKSFVVKTGLVAGNLVVTNTDITHGNVYANTIAVIVSNTAVNSVLTFNQLYVGNSTVNAVVNGTNIVVGGIATINSSGVFSSNTTGLLNTGTVNAATHSVGTAWIANATVTNIATGNVTVNSSGLFVANATGLINAPTVNAATFSVSTAFTANSTLVNTAAINVTGRTNTATLFATTSANVGANVQVTTSAITFGNGTSTSTEELRISNSTGNSVLTATSLKVVSVTANSTLVNAPALNVVAGTNTQTLYVQTTFSVGSNVSANLTAVRVGNATTNSVLGNSDLYLGNTTNYVQLNTTDLRISNGSQTAILTIPTSTAWSSTNYFLHANGSWVVVPGNPPAGSDTQVQYNSSGSYGASAGLTFAVGSNNLTIGNTLFVPLVSANIVSGNTVTAGNSTVNVVANTLGLRLANSTVNTGISIPTAGNYSATNVFLHANGSWATVPGTPPGGSATHVQFNSGSALAGNAGFTYNTTGNVVTIANSLVVPNANVTTANILTILNVGANVVANLTTIKVGNSTVYITANQIQLVVNRTTGANGTDDIVATDGSQWMRFNSNPTAALWNPLISAGDVTLAYSKGTIDTGVLVIAPHSASAKGIKIDVGGNVAIGQATASSKLTVNGVITATGNVGAAYFTGNGNALTSTKWNGASYTVSTSAPSGGSDGDFWFERVA